VNAIYPNTSLADWSFPVNSVSYGANTATIDFSALNTSTEGFSTTQETTVATMYLKSTRSTTTPILLSFDQNQTKMMTKQDPPQDILVDPNPGSYSFVLVPTATPTPRPTSTPVPTNTPTPVPTSTLVPTPTEVPTPTFSFGFKLQGVEIPSIVKTINLVFDTPNTSANGSAVREYTVAVVSDANGVFKPTSPVELTGLPVDITGTYYDVFVENSHHLTKLLGTTLITAGANFAPTQWELQELLAGDFIENNAINLFDISDFLTIYIQLETPVNASNAKYNVNENDVINIIDIAIALSNYTELIVPGDEY
jgi:hypothetical protein